MKNMKPEYILPAIYWLLAAILILIKALGLSTISWFWSTIMVTWPFILFGGLLAITLGFVVIAFICVIGIEVWEDYTCERQLRAKTRKDEKVEEDNNE